MFGKNDDYLVPKCPKCKTFNVSTNMDDNSIECQNPECKYTGKEKLQINLQEFREDIQKQEQMKINAFINEDPNIFLAGLNGNNL